MGNFAQYALLTIALAALLFWGTQNRPDPVWQEAERLLRTDFRTLDEAVDSIQLLFNEFHGFENLADGTTKSADSTAFKLLAKPFLPTMEWRKFQESFEWVAKNKRAVIASINGSGATTLADRMAHFIAISPENLLEIHCAPQFDVEFHKKYIGTDTESGAFKKGLLLQFWDRCRANPAQKFVCVTDNFDKINPETFFGPELWEKLDDPRRTVKIGGETIEIPDNFYFIAMTSSGVASHIELTQSHFRRLGGQHILPPNTIEFVENLRNRKREAQRELAGATDDKSRQKLEATLAALSDTLHLTRLTTFFAKSNALLAERYSPHHQLGQWSSIRKLVMPGDLPELREVFIGHINALEPGRVMSGRDFADIDYTLETNGLEANSSFLARQIQFLQDTGYFVEITLITATSLVTALAGWWVFRRREKLLRKYGERTREIFEQYENQVITAESASEQLDKIKLEVDALVLSRKLNYTEALYFLGFIDERVKRIEFARRTSETFLDLMNTFLEDQVLTENEYQKLNSFLNSIRHKIPQNEYERFRDEVEMARKQFQ